VAVAVDAGEVRSAGGATASGRRSRNGLWEEEEKSLRDLFCYIIATLFFLYAHPSAALFPAPPVSPPSVSGKKTPSVPIHFSSGQWGP
jgi:hypothetical protein